MAYTDEQKTQAVEVYRTEGMAAAHQATGIPKPSIKRWADERGVATERSDEQTKAATEAHVAKMAEERRNARSKLSRTAQTLLDRIEDEDAPSKCQALATSAAILIDKWQVIGWGDGEVETPTGNQDLDRLREEARARGEHLVSVPA